MSEIRQAHPVPRAEAVMTTVTGQGRPSRAAAGAPGMAGSPPDQVGESQMAAVRETAREFEAMLLSELLAPMFDGLETGGPFGGGQAEETWRGLMIEQYGAEIARSGGIGIADQLVRELLHVQESETS